MMAMGKTSLLGPDHSFNSLDYFTSLAYDIRHLFF